MEALDKRICPLYEHGLGCRIIGAALEEDPVIILKRVRRMGIVRSVDEARVVTPEKSLPFEQRISKKNLRAEALGIAIQWFLARGYIPSIPVEPTRYDLVVESDTGLQKVQVKTTNAKEVSTGHWNVKVYRKAYDKKAIPNAHGKTRNVPYSKGEVGFFFIVVGDGGHYLIPFEEMEGSYSLVLDKKYKAFKVS